MTPPRTWGEIVTEAIERAQGFLKSTGDEEDMAAWGILETLKAEAVDPLPVTSDCRCFFDPKYEHPECQHLAMLVFGTATYGVRMDMGDEPDMIEYVTEVVRRFRATIDLMVRGGHNHDPDGNCYPGCPVWHQENPT